MHTYIFYHMQDYLTTQKLKLCTIVEVEGAGHFTLY